MPQPNADASGDRIPPSTELHGTRLIVVTLCAIAATVMQALDSTIANVALPYMQGSMAASQDEINWVLTSYIVATAIMTAPVGFLASRFGRTRLFLTSIIGFTIASVLCGAAQSLAQIVLFRILQGGFSAALVPISQGMMYEIYPPAKRSSAMALWGMGVMVGPVLGPILGGWLTENYNWRWVFFINVPFGVLATLGLIVALKDTPHSKTRLDWTGFAALSLGVGALQTLLDRGETLDWFSSGEIQIEALLTAIGFYIFIVQSALAPKPFLSPRLFRDRNFFSSVLIMFLLGGMLYASMALLAPYLQVLMNYPVATAGLVMAPRGVGAMTAALVVGRIMDKVGVRTVMLVGFVFVTVSLYSMTSWTPDVSEFSIAATGFLQGLGTSSITVPLSAIAFATLPLELRLEGTSVFSLLRNIGSSIGISVTAALLTVNTQLNHAIISAAVTPFNRFLQTGAPLEFWNPALTRGAAALDAVITRQSTIIAYADDFKLLLILTIVAAPLTLLIRTSRIKPPTPAVAE
jgi:DHA2 family multidrug resistance protein